MAVTKRSAKRGGKRSSGQKAAAPVRYYPERMEQAFPTKKRMAEARRLLESAGVKYLLSCWIDILGSPKTKPVPVAELENLCLGKGPQFAVHSVTMFPELGPSDPDQIPIPDLDSLVICPWDPEIAIVFADLYYEEEAYNVCPRLALKRQVQAAADAGYRFMAGMEPEFMVMRHDEDGRLIKAYQDDRGPDARTRLRRQAYGYDMEFSIDAMPFLAEMIEHMTALDWGLKNVVCEGAYSQFELDFHYTDVVSMADRFTLFRVMAKEVAKAHGMFATFMPKPTQSDWRNGAHINWSVQPIDRPGVNLFEDKGTWSEAAMQAIAGVVKHGVAITAVNCSTVNSYKGLIGRAKEFEGGTVTWAPTHIVHGHNNRSAMLRLPQARFAIENRAVDMCVNPYLGLAMTCAASLEGIAKGYRAPAPIDTSLYDVGRGKQRGTPQSLPGTLLEAITGFDEDPLAKAVFGETMHTLFSRHKHDEWERYHEHVSDWETKEYLRYL